MRALAILLAIATSIPPVLLAVNVIVTTVPQFSNPCFEWGAGASGSFRRRIIRTHDPCEAMGHSSTSETKRQAVIRLLLIPGGIMLAGALAIWGALRRRPMLTVLGAILMFLDSLPFLLTLASVAALTSGAYVLVARTSAPLTGAPKVMARILGSVAALFALNWIWIAVWTQVHGAGPVPPLLLLAIAFQLFVTAVAWWPENQGRRFHVPVSSA